MFTQGVLTRGLNLPYIFSDGSRGATEYGAFGDEMEGIISLQ